MAETTNAVTLGALLRRARGVLDKAGKADAALEARLIVEKLTGLGRREAIVEADRPVPPAEAEAVEAALARRLAGEPVHRILGRRPFHGVELTVTPDTLDPRPDTEALVDLVLPVLREAVRRDGECRLLDLGTGTGAIALALLAEVPRARAVATDISAAALETAAANADLNGLRDRFEPVLSDWFRDVEGRFHAIVANPPYIATGQIGSLEPEVRDFDPLLALDGGPDGLAAYRKIVAGARNHMELGGVVAVEIGHEQKSAVTRLFEAGGFRLEDEASDLAGRDRTLMFVLDDTPNCAAQKGLGK